MSSWIWRPFGSKVGSMFCARLASGGWAADWPTYRGDAMRSGYTVDVLPKNLSPSVTST